MKKCFSLLIAVFAFGLLVKAEFSMDDFSQKLKPLKKEILDLRLAKEIGIINLNILCSGCEAAFEKIQGLLLQQKGNYQFLKKFKENYFLLE